MSEDKLKLSEIIIELMAMRDAHIQKRDGAREFSPIFFHHEENVSHLKSAIVRLSMAHQSNITDWN